MVWKKHSANHYTADGPGGEWSVERRAGIWMVFDPREDQAIMSGLRNAKDGMALADKLARH